MATIDFLWLLRTIRLRYFAARELLVLRAALAHSHKIYRMMALPLRVFPDFLLPADSLLPGHNAAQEASLSASPKRDISSPISMRIKALDVASMHGIVCKSSKAYW